MNYIKKKGRNMLHRIGKQLLAFYVLAPFIFSFSATTSAANAMIEEVVVTARKQQE